ncbi:MAG: S8 family serine peptidase, partial [Clostridiales bacterium]|nr:S8 family serine peptidase [Clostridiales bacterium]
ECGEVILKSSASSTNEESKQNGYSDIGLSSLHSKGFDGEGLTVAVIDTDFDTDIEAFTSKTVQNPKLSKNDIDSIIQSGSLNARVASADSCYISDKIPFAYNYYTNSSSLSSGYKGEYSGHGTHVAGIIAGNCDEFQGVAPEAQLILMSVSSSGTEKTSLDNILAAIDDAAMLDADAINMSLGFDYYSPSHPAGKLIDRAITNAAENGIIVCAAAGNSSVFSSNPEEIDNSTTGIPGSCRSAITVGSCGKDGISTFSSFCVTSFLETGVDITAPGEDIYSCVNDGNYDSLSGTSMSSPMMCGSAVLINQYINKNRPDIPGTEKVQFLKNIIKSTAVPSDKTELPRSPRVQGAGIVNLENAVNTNAVLSGPGGDCSLNLGDGIDDRIEFSFTAKNISSNSITYDTLNFSVLKDNVGHFRFLPESVSEVTGLSDNVRFTFTTSFPEGGITLSAGEEKEIKAVITPDSKEIAKQSEIFKNGFYLEGFVYLSDSTGKETPLSIPFMGFHGSFAKQSAGDRINKENIYLLRSMRDVAFSLINSNGKEVMTNTIKYIPKGRFVSAGMWLFESETGEEKLKYPESGKYTVIMTGYPDIYTGDVKSETFELNFKFRNDKLEIYNAFATHSSGTEDEYHFIANRNDVTKIEIDGAAVYNRNYHNAYDITEEYEVTTYGYFYSVKNVETVDRSVITATGITGLKARQGRYSPLYILLKPILILIDMVRKLFPQGFIPPLNQA